MRHNGTDTDRGIAYTLGAAALAALGAVQVALGAVPWLWLTLACAGLSALLILASRESAPARSIRVSMHRRGHRPRGRW